MYNEDSKTGIRVISTVVKIIFVILVILLLAWLFPKVPKMDAFYGNVFRENIKYMQEAGKGYFTKDKLPKEIGDLEKINLSDMLDKKLILPFVDKDGKSCDQYESYVSITKEKDYYVLKTNLVCGEEKDYINEIIGCYSYCEDDNCDKKCTTSQIMEYQHKKAVTKDVNSYTCEDDYKLSGKYCYKTTLVDKNSAETVTTTKRTEITDSIKNTTENKIVYDNYVVTDGKTVKTCPSGTYLSGDVCVYTKTPTSSYTCPSGTYLSNGKCIYTQNPTSGYTCPSGTYLSNGKCIYTQNPTTGCYCPSGSTANGNTCVFTQTPTVSSKCPSGYYDNGSQCYSTSTIPGSSYTVPAQASESCSVKSYCDTKNGSNYEYIGTTTSDSCTVAYKYKVCSTNYSCSQGSLSGTSCVVSTGSTSSTVYANKITSYVCPSNWTLTTNNICTYTQAATNCTSCPTGWKLDTTKNVCWKGETASTKQTCPTGWKIDTEKNVCWKGETASTRQTCPTGWKIDTAKNVCWTSEPATNNSGKVYSCKEGWVKSGDGTNTVCYKNLGGQTTYSCADKDALLNNVDKKCYKVVTGKFTELKCDEGYKLEGKYCMLYETDKESANKTVSEKTSYNYKWSTESTLKGWTKTGKTRVTPGKTICE